MSNAVQTRERECPHIHETVAEAIRCAERNLGVLPGQKLRPYRGTTRLNSGLIVGWQLSPRRRWRLDYDVDKGPHINEENFDLPWDQAKTVHRLPRPLLTGETMIRLQWMKWTAAGDVEK